MDSASARLGAAASFRDRPVSSPSEHHVREPPGLTPSTAFPNITFTWSAPYRTSLFQRTYSLRSRPSEALPPPPMQQRQSVLGRHRRVSLRGHSLSAERHSISPLSSESLHDALLCLARHLPPLIAASDQLLALMATRELIVTKIDVGDSILQLAHHVCHAFVACASAGLQPALVGWSGIVRSVIDAGSECGAGRPEAPSSRASLPRAPSDASPRYFTRASSLSLATRPRQAVVSGLTGTRSWSWSDVTIDVVPKELPRGEMTRLLAVSSVTSTYSSRSAVDERRRDGRNASDDRDGRRAVNSSLASSRLTLPDVVSSPGHLCAT